MSSIFYENGFFKVFNLSEQSPVIFVSWYSINYIKYETGFLNPVFFLYHS
jgi:hypothetical protein